MLKTLIISWCLLFNFISITKVEADLNSEYSFIPTIEVKGSIFVDDAHAQAEALSLAAKSKNNDMAQYYLPMLVMLGIGVMAIYMMMKLEKKSPDFYMFLVGAVVYLISVITGWKDEKAKFAELPEEISKNSQVSALELQRDSIKEVLEMVKKRLMLQGAATAAFLASAITAGVLYGKEKAAQAKLQAAIAAQIQEFSTICQRIPELNVPGSITIGAMTSVPMYPRCQVIAAAGQACMTGVNSDVRNLFQIDETLRSEAGSAAMSGDQQAFFESIQALSAACFDSIMPPPTTNDNQRAYVYHPNEEAIKEDMRKFYVENGIDIRSAKELVIITDDEGSLATKLAVRLLNEIVSEAKANALGAVATRMGAGETIGSSISRIAGAGAGYATGKAPSPQEVYDQFISDSTQDRATSMCMNQSGGCPEGGEQRYLALAEAEVNAASTTLQAGAGQAVGNVANAGTRATGRAIGRGAGNVLRRSGNITSAANRTSASRMAQRGVVRRAATRVATGTAVRVVAAGVAATAVAPVVITSATIALTAYTAYEVGGAAYRWVVEHDKVASENRRRAMEEGRCRQTRRGMRCRGDVDLKKLFSPEKTGSQQMMAKNTPRKFNHRVLDFLSDFFIGKANATLPLASILPGISNTALGVAEEVTEEADHEADMWFFNPKVRLVLYSAISAITALITLNTNKMKKRLEQDLEQVQSIIDEMNSLSSNNTSLESREELINDERSPAQESEEDINGDQSSFFPQPKQQFNFLSLFINNAQAANRPALGVLPFTVPCMVPYRGKCYSTTSYLSRATRDIKFEKFTKRAVLATARIGNRIQRRNYVTQEVLNEAKVLNDLRPSLEQTLKLTKKIINQQRVKKYNQKPIPFEKYEKSLTQRFMNFGKRAVANVDDPSSITSIFGPGVFNDLKREPRGQSENEVSSTNAIAFNEGAKTETSNVYAHNDEARPEMKRKYKNADLGINKRKEDSIFQQISRRYLLWQTAPR